MTGSGPGVGTFLGLKLRLLRNGFRGAPVRILMFVLGGVFGALAAGLGFLLFAALGTGSSTGAQVGVVLFGMMLVLGWLLMPLLLFGVDETLDPARFALLPVPAPRLMTGLFAGAALGIPAAATLIATSGLVVGALAHGPGPALVAATGVLLGLATCLAGSRALTSGLAALLRSRRARDLGVVVVAMLAAVLAPLQILTASLAGAGRLDDLLPVARTISWTPLAAPYAAMHDAAAGRPLAAATRLGIAAVTVVLLLWWWARSLESAMVGAVSGGTARAGRAGPGTLVPRALRRLLPADPFGAIVAREVRYWWRDPRRRGGLLSLAVGSAVGPLLVASTGGRTSLVVMAVFVGALLSVVAANLFGYDGTAYAAQLLAGVRGRTELRARMAAIAIVTGPWIAALTVAIALVAGAPGTIPLLVGTAFGAFGVALGLMALICVIAAYPMPESSNPFAMNTGGGCLKGLAQLGAWVGTFLLAAPLLVVALLLNWRATGFDWLVLPLGLVYGLVGSELGARFVGALLDRRGPELLRAVTPRR